MDILKTQLKRGYTWVLRDNDMVEITVRDKPSVWSDTLTITIDKVGQYSLAAFLLRVLRHRGVKRPRRVRGLRRQGGLMK